MKGDQEITLISVEGLAKIGIFLEGYKVGKGNILPLGLIELENLWNTIQYLNGDVRFKLPKEAPNEHNR